MFVLNIEFEPFPSQAKGRTHTLGHHEILNWLIEAWI